MKLYEVFKSKDRVALTSLNIPGADIFKFEHNNITYIIQFLKISKLHPLYVSMKDKPKLTNNTYFFAFAAEIDGELTDKDINRHDAMFVLSQILQHLVKYVQTHNVDQLILGCDETHEKRKRLYQKIVDKYTKEYDWKVLYTTIIDYIGPKYTWVIAKNI